MRKSCIVQRKNSRIVVLHEDYIEICDGNMIAAMILSILIYWTDVKLAQREQEQEQRKATGEDIPLTSLWIWKSQEGFQHDLLVDKPGMRQVHRSTIATALSLLKDKKFIQVRRNPNNNIDRTQQYLIEQDTINEAIKALPDCTKTITRMSEIVQSNVGNQSMDCTETDNGLHKNRQTIPEITNRDYNTENTEQREREGVAIATARSQSSQEISLSDDNETEKREAIKPDNPDVKVFTWTLGPVLMPIVNLKFDETVKREAVKPSQKETHGTSAHPAPGSAVVGNAGTPGSNRPERQDTNKVAQPPAPKKPPTNTIPKRPKQQPITTPVSPEAQRILDDWVSLFTKKIVINQGDIDAAEHLVPTNITCEEMRQERLWLFSTDNPQKPWYRKIGVCLADIDKKYSQWQSIQDAPKPAPDKDESNEHRVSSFGTPGYNFADEFYPSEAEKKRYRAAQAQAQEVKA